MKTLTTVIPEHDVIGTSSTCQCGADDTDPVHMVSEPNTAELEALVLNLKRRTTPRLAVTIYRWNTYCEHGHEGISVPVGHLSSEDAYLKAYEHFHELGCGMGGCDSPLGRIVQVSIARRQVTA